MADANNEVSYLEMATSDIGSTKKFFSDAFGWKFIDYGPDYTSFALKSVSGGFYKADKSSPSGILVVLYNNDLEKTKAVVVKSGGTISKEVFEFPGGKRFHFKDPNGIEMAVWSE